GFSVGVVTSLLPKFQGVATFLLKKPSIKVFYSLFLIKVLTIRNKREREKNEKNSILIGIIYSINWCERVWGCR
ncbi:hypothetical protein M3202_20915, partial [Alkalihalobacillus oceani]